MKDKPKVAVLVFTYNHQRFIIDCLESIYQQDYGRDNFDVFIFDNASTDLTYRVITGNMVYRNKMGMKNYSYLHTQYRTECIGHFRFKAFDYIDKRFYKYKYKYVAIVDGDDKWTNDKLRKQVALAEEKGSYLVFSDCYYLKYRINEKKEFPVKWDEEESWIDGTFFGKYHPFNERHFENLLLSYNYMPCPTLLFNIENLAYCIDKPMAYISAEDYDWILKIALLTERIHYVDEPLAYYRIHENQATKRTPVRCTYEELDCLRRFKQYISKDKMKRYWYRVILLYMKMFYKELFYEK